MPQWLALDLDVLGGGVQAGAPAHDAVGARVHRHVARRRAASGLRRGPRRPSSSRRPGRSRENRPGTPSLPSVATASIWQRTSGWTGSGSVRGSPASRCPDTRSGRRRASTLAKVPPRLWPTIAARRPWRSTSARGAAPGARSLAPEQATLARMPGRLGVVAGALEPAGHDAAATRRRPGSPGSAAPAGRARRSRPRPRNTGSRSSAASSRPMRDSRQKGGWVVVSAKVIDLCPTYAAGPLPDRRNPNGAAGLDFQPCERSPFARTTSWSRSTPIPAPGPGEILVAVGPPASTAPTCCSARARYPAPPGSPPDIPGLELAGEVVRPRARRRALRARATGVMAIVGGGGQAELAVLHERAAMPVPDGLDWPARRRRRRGVRDRPRRAVHPGRPAAGRAPAGARRRRAAWAPRRCSWAARPAPGDRHRPQRGAARTRSRELGAEVDRARGLRRAAARSTWCSSWWALPTWRPT